jgi:hypothetical protein
MFSSTRSTNLHVRDEAMQTFEKRTLDPSNGLVIQLEERIHPTTLISDIALTCACVYARFSFLSSYQRVMPSVHAILIASDGNIRYLTLRNIINRGWISVERGGRASLSDDDVTAYYTALRKDSIGETLEKPPRGTYRYQRHAIGPSVQSRRFGIVIPRDTEHIYAYIRRTYISIP